MSTKIVARLLGVGEEKVRRLIGSRVMTIMTIMTIMTTLCVFSCEVCCSRSRL